MADSHRHALVNSEELNTQSCKTCSDRFTEASHKLCFLKKGICIILTLPVLNLSSPAHSPKPRHWI